MRLATIGVSGNLRRANNNGIRATAAGAGVFADLGATWFVTSHLSLGASWTVQLDYLRYSYSTTPVKRSSWSLDGGGIEMRGGLYF
jgi:hypothetical protein